MASSPGCFKRAVHAMACTRAQRDLQQVWSCDVCGDLFKSRQARAVHAFRKHGVKRRERQFIDTTRCPICLLEFWSRERVIAHVCEKREVCRINLLQREPILTAAQADELDRIELTDRARSNRRSGLRRAHASKPCVRLSGPLCNFIPLDDAEGAHHPLGRGHKWMSY